MANTLWIKGTCQGLMACRDYTTCVLSLLVSNGHLLSGRLDWEVLDKCKPYCWACFLTPVYCCGGSELHVGPCIAMPCALTGVCNMQWVRVNGGDICEKRNKPKIVSGLHLGTAASTGECIKSLVRSVFQAALNVGLTAVIAAH